MKKITELLHKIEGEGYSRQGEMLSNTRNWHELRQEVARQEEREAMLKANPAVRLPGDTPARDKH